MTGVYCSKMFEKYVCTFLLYVYSFPTNPLHNQALSSPLPEIGVIMMEVCKDAGVAIPEELNQSAKTSQQVRSTVKHWMRDTLSRDSLSGGLLSNLKSRQNSVIRRKSFSVTKSNSKAVPDVFSDILSFMRQFESPLIEAEMSCLVDIILHAEDLFCDRSYVHRQCQHGGFIKKLIDHVKGSLYSKDISKDEWEKSAISIINLLKKIVSVSELEPDRVINEKREPEAYKVRMNLLSRYFANELSSRHLRSLPEVQSDLNKLGVVDLVITLISYAGRSSTKIFDECIDLATCLLQDGNTDVQFAFLNKCNQDATRSSRFFKIIFEKFERAQEELKNQQPETSRFLEDVDIMKRQSHNNDGCSPRGTSMGMGTYNMMGAHVQNANVTLPSSIKTQLDLTARQTKNYRKRSTNPEVPGDPGYDSSAAATGPDGKPKNEISNSLKTIMAILRFLQLLCENHNKDLQNYLRFQKYNRENNKRSYDLVSETLKILDSLCGSTTGGLGLLGLYVKEEKVPIIKQALETLTEYCQGPCYENQSCIANHECNGLDIIVALVLNEIDPLSSSRFDLVLDLKNCASKVLGFLGFPHFCTKSQFLTVYYFMLVKQENKKIYNLCRYKFTFIKKGEHRHLIRRLKRWSPTRAVVGLERMDKNWLDLVRFALVFDSLRSGVLQYSP